MREPSTAAGLEAVWSSARSVFILGARERDPAGQLSKCGKHCKNEPPARKIQRNTPIKNMTGINIPTEKHRRHFEKYRDYN